MCAYLQESAYDAHVWAWLAWLANYEMTLDEAKAGGHYQSAGSHDWQ
jgi:hypothetical protein